MAVPLHRLGAFALRSTFKIRPRRLHNAQLFPSRRIHAASILQTDRAKPTATPQKLESSTAAPTDEVEVEQDAEREAEIDLIPNAGNSAETKPPNQSDPSVPFQPEADSFSMRVTPEEEREALQQIENASPELKAKIDELRATLDKEYEKALRDTPVVRDIDLVNAAKFEKTKRVGLLSMGDEDEEDVWEDEAYEGDDITSLGHAHLEQHREIREYARLAAWELPLLTKFAKPYTPPTADQPLRFRYTTYMGEEHPAENKVGLEFCTADLPLKPAERLKLVKLLGSRYDPQTDLVRMSCESFDSQAQNKRYLGDLVETLVATARGQGDSEAAKDSFEDVPVDFRHVKWNQKPQFPEEWKMTPERQRLLQEKRAALAAGEQKRIEEGTLVDGLHVIAESQKITPTSRLLTSAKTLNSRLQKAPHDTHPRRPELRIR